MHRLHLQDYSVLNCTKCRLLSVSIFRPMPFYEKRVQKSWKPELAPINWMKVHIYNDLESKRNSDRLREICLNNV